MKPHGSWPPWPPTSPHSNEIEHRVTLVEYKVDRVSEDHVEHKEKVASKILWLERGLQAVAYGLLTLAFWLAPTKAQGIAETIIGLLKR